MHVINNNIINNSILIADDDRLIRMVFREFLADRGFDIHEAENGKEALSLYAEVVPGLIITDINMPIMNGLDFILNLRSMDNSIPIIAASSDESVLEAALRNGANEVFPKMSDITNLIKSVNSLMGIN